MEGTINKKLVIFGMLVIVLVAGVILGQMIVGASETNYKNTEISIEDIVVLEMEEPIIVNLAQGGIIRISIGIGADSKASSKKLEKIFGDNEIIIRNEIINLLREKTYDDVNQLDAQSKIGAEIKESINNLIGEECVYEIYFREYLVQ